jgi:Tat protein translocase TatC
MAALAHPLTAHLATIKRRLLVIAATITGAFVLTFAYASELIEWLKRPFPDDLLFYAPTEALFASIKVSLLAGVVLSLPVILYQFWKFIEPALLPREQRWAIPLFGLGAGLFALGLVFCNLVILPLVVRFFVEFGMDRELTPQLAVGTYVDFNVQFLLTFGFAFELPLVLTLLSRIGVVSAPMLARYRKHAMLVAVIASAIITPDATLFSMLLMAVPLMVLYEIGIWGARLFGQRNATAGGGDLTGPPTPVTMQTAGHRLRSLVWTVALAASLPVAALAEGTAMDVQQVQAPRARPDRGHDVLPPIGQSPSIQALAVGKQSVYAGSFGSGVFRSDDRGANWSPINRGLTDPFVLCLAIAPDGAVYAGTFRGGVFRTRDAGQTWEPLNAGLKRLEVKVLLVDGPVIYAGTGDGVYRLAAGEDRWTVLTKGLDETLVHALVMTPDRTLFAGTSGKGVFRRDAAGTGWTRLSQGLVDHEGLVENFIRVLTVGTAQVVYAGTFDGGVFRSPDGGRTWRPISRALPNDSIRGIVTHDQGLFVATGRGIFKTTNEGQNWTPVNTGLAELSIQVLIASRDGTLYAGTSSGAFRTDDAGGHWVSISDGLQAK